MKRQLEGSSNNKRRTGQAHLHFTHTEKGEKLSSDEKFYRDVIKEFQKASNALDYFKDYSKQVESQGQDGILIDDVDQDMPADGSLMSPAFLMKSIKGKDEELMKRKSINLMKLFYHSSTKGKEKT